MDREADDSVEVQSLLQRARTGERQAFEELFELHRMYLRRLVVLRLDPRLRARVDPSDVVQEAQLEAARRLADYLEKPPLPFRLWLRQIAWDRVLKAHRTHAETARRALGREVPLPEQSSVALARQLLAGGPTPSENLNQRDLARRLRQAIGRLSSTDRDIVLMRDFEGLSNQEVGSLLGIDPATASKRHGRALLRLYKILCESGLTGSQL